MNKGIEFEKLVADIERLLANDSNTQILHNETLVDAKGGKRRIDVLIIHKNDRFEYKTIIECKNTKAKVNINTVEAFKGLISSIGAHQGIIVSASGFQSGARRAAQASNVLLYQLSEAEDLKSHLAEYRFNMYELKHESKDIVVGFNFTSPINEEISNKSLLHFPFIDKPVSISDIATNFLQNHSQTLIESMLRSVDDPFKSQIVVGITKIHIAFSTPLIFQRNAAHTEVAGFRAEVETTLTTNSVKIEKISRYGDVVKASTEALVFEMRLDGDSFQFLQKQVNK